MKALCVDSVPRLLLPFLFAEVSEQFIMNIVGVSVVGPRPAREREDHTMSLNLSYQAFASKKPADKRKASRKGKGEDTGNKPRGTVLVVDDVPDVTEMIELLLKHAGYDV